MGEIIKKQDTRRAFVEALNEVADEKTIVVIPDVGFNYLDQPGNKFKVINTGVNEQFAAIFAANLALQGWKVFFYSMINFVLFRPGEMVRNAIVCHNAPVMLLGVKGSSSYKFLGFSHNLLHNAEDLNFCENIRLEGHVAVSQESVKELVKDFIVNPRPIYVRL